jgi:hypothetical protein
MPSHFVSKSGAGSVKRPPPPLQFCAPLFVLLSQAKAREAASDLAFKTLAEQEAEVEAAAASSSTALEEEEEEENVVPVRACTQPGPPSLY